MTPGPGVTELTESHGPAGRCGAGQGCGVRPRTHALPQADGRAGQLHGRGVPPPGLQVRPGSLPVDLGSMYGECTAYIWCHIQIANFFPAGTAGLLRVVLEIMYSVCMAQYRIHSTVSRLPYCWSGLRGQGLNCIQNISPIFFGCREEQRAPGTKVVLQDAPVKNGVVALENKCFKVGAGPFGCTGWGNASVVSFSTYHWHFMVGSLSDALGGETRQWYLSVLIVSTSRWVPPAWGALSAQQ